MSERPKQHEMDELWVYYPSLLKKARHLLREQADAEDVVQDVVLSLIDAPNLLHGVDRLGAWLTTVVHRRCVDFIRGKVRRREHLEQQQHVEQWQRERERDDSLETEELATALESAILALDEELRFAFVEQAINEKTFAQISEESGIPMGTLMARKKRAVANLKTTLQEQGWFVNQLAKQGDET